MPDVDEMGVGLRELRPRCRVRLTLRDGTRVSGLVRSTGHGYIRLRTRRGYRGDLDFPVGAIARATLV